MTEQINGIEAGLGKIKIGSHLRQFDLRPGHSATRECRVLQKTGDVLLVSCRFAGGKDHVYSVTTTEMLTDKKGKFRYEVVDDLLDRGVDRFRPT